LMMAKIWRECGMSFLPSSSLDSTMSIQGATRTAFIVFFTSHIPITVLVDGQAFLPRDWYPQSLIDIVDWYTSTFKVRQTTC
jgi:hypothetical protein